MFHAALHIGCELAKGVQESERRDLANLGARISAAERTNPGAGQRPAAKEREVFFRADPVAIAC